MERAMSKERFPEKKRLIELHKKLAELRIERAELIAERDFSQRIGDAVRTKKARSRLVAIEIELGQTEAEIQATEFALLKRLLKERGCPVP